MAATGDKFEKLVEIMATLRGPNGCPWDKQQDFNSLKPMLVEEVYEVLEAVENQDFDGLSEELGDMLLHVLFHAQLGKETGQFDINTVIEKISDKLVRRHPHVFAREAGEPALDSADKVVTRWEEIKAAERGGTAKKKTLLSGVPTTMPALLRAYEIGIRAKAVGFDWTKVSDVVDKIQEEVDELREVIESPALDRERAEEEMGDLLFTIAHLSRQLGIEPETALRKANDKFTKRFESMESAIAASGRKMSDMALDELESEWQRVKD
jgi:MazG family protein